MYVREARNRDEAWLLDRIDELGVDEVAFRSRDYVIAMDEEAGEKVGFGRIRVHKGEDGEYCELTGIGILPDWRGAGVGAHVIERLIENASDEGFETVYAVVGEPEYYEQFGFREVAVDDLPEPLSARVAEKREAIVPDATSLSLEVARFTMPENLREAFKTAGGSDASGENPEESAEDFGIDPDEATYKYDTGR
ncbi:MAG: GNAT family N-acetyltransferase [Halobacteriales archaeon]